MKAFEERNAHFDRLLRERDLRWMGQNTNHHPAHPAVRAALIDCIEAEAFHAYAPPAGLEDLRAGILAELGLDGQSAMVTDGAVSGLYHVCRTFCRPGDTFVTTDPTWAWPMRFARDAGATVIQVPIYGTEHGWRLDPRRLRDHVDGRTRVIYLVDPNNPLGTVATAAEIAAICEVARAVGALLVHDCTYRDFAHEHHLAAHLYPERTITVWSFSKWLGFAGLRVGALVAAPDIIDELMAAPPNNLGSSLLAQRGALAGLRVKSEWFPEVLASQRDNGRRVRAAVEGVPGLSMPVATSHGNFVIIECEAAGIRPEALVEAYRRRKIMIRHGGYHTPAFGSRFVKVSLTVPREWADAFCDALPAAVEEARGLNAVAAAF